MTLLLATLLLQADWKTESIDVRIPMRDGKALAADIYLPPKEGKYPAVLIQTPYDKKHLGAPISTGTGEGGEVGRGAVADMLGLLDREHYAYVVVDWRGFYGSKDAMEGVSRLRWRRGLDGYDCVEWIAVQAWSDGKVGTWGGSALGKQQFDTAAEHPPHLVCAAPLIAGMGQSYGAYYEGGVYREAHVKMLDFLGYGVSRFALNNPLPDTVVWRTVEQMTYRPDAIEIPCLVITGWWDNYPAEVIRTFEDLGARERSKLLIGPWDHVSIGVAKQGQREFAKAAGESGKAARAFFDRWLRGKDNGWDETPSVRYWVVNEEGWRDAESWSSIKRTTHTLAVELKAREYTYDPKDAPPTLGGANLPPLMHGPADQSKLAERKDVIVWSTGKLKEPIRIVGEVELTLEMKADQACFDTAARLCDVRDGKAWLLCDTIQRTWDAKPGDVVKVALKFPPTAAAVDELAVYISSGNSPRYERNPHTGADHWDAAKALPLKVELLGGEIRIPVPE